MKKLVKILFPMLLLISCFIAGYQWSIKSEEVVYDVTTERFIHDNPDTIISRIEKKEAGIYYFGFESCPWCVELVPLLDEILEKNDKQAYVVNTRSEAFTDELRERTDKIYQAHQEGHLTVPFLVVISEKGEVQTHIGTVDGHDAYSTQMTAKQGEELRTLLQKLISGDCGCSN